MSEPERVEVEQTTVETLYYQPWPGGEWITAYNEPQWYRDQGFPVKRVTIHHRVETEYLS